MKHINEYINEAIKITSKSRVNEKQYFPKDKYELKDIIIKLIDERGYEADLDDIDTSKITDMSYLFSNGKLSNFDGCISGWDTKNVENMEHMFDTSEFSGKNGNISCWDLSSVKNMSYMFFSCKKLSIKLERFEPDPSVNVKNMFKFCPIKYVPLWYRHRN